MLKFSEFKKNLSRQYVSLRLSKESNDKMTQWCRDKGFDLTVDHDGDPKTKNDFHCTIFYSENQVALKPGMHPITAIKLVPKGFEWFGEEKNMPVMTFHITDELGMLRDVYVTTGLKDKWPEWKPHVTLSYQTDKKVDVEKLEKPEFSIYGDRIEIRAIKDEPTAESC